MNYTAHQIEEAAKKVYGARAICPSEYAPARTAVQEAMLNGWVFSTRGAILKRGASA